MVRVAQPASPGGMPISEPPHGGSAVARKLNKNLVALGSAAIVVVYAAGFARTAGSATDNAAQAQAYSTTNPAVAISRSIAATPSAVTATPGAPAIAAPAGASTTAGTMTRYSDGTFTGSGSNRFGQIDVAVTIKGGAITAVQITRATTRYPAGRIAALPGQVVQRQSAQVDFVTGATYSSRAFKDAVSQAIGRAGGDLVGAGGPAQG